ncbi:MAG TPA: DUF3788 family protein [bacterium]|nr:DUF3788 family protein [bacterium]HPR89032.1 DUF3788 family protein [bacterium]
MEEKVLSDPDQYPSDEIIFAHLGQAKPLWLAFFDHIAQSYPDMTTEWRYYRDGKSWLFKAVLKKRTIFWLSLVPGAFRTTFYYGEKAALEVEASAIPEEFKRQFREGKPFGKIRGLTIVHTTPSDLAVVRILMEIRIRNK